MSLTYGTEAEFATNAAALTEALHREGLTGDSHSHSYHCDCDSCMFTHPDDRDDVDYKVYTFRVQNDSTCSGEVISNIMTLDDGFDHFAMLQLLAVETDAEPGTTAGFHVHVAPDESLDSNDSIRRGRIALQFARAEPALMLLARGAMPHVREYNYPIAPGFRYWLADNIGQSEDELCITRREKRTAVQLDRFNDQHRDDVVMMRCLFDHARGFDRHSNLNLRPAETVEFRLWNSTRAAWRMELFVRMSVFMSSRAGVEGCEAHDSLARTCYTNPELGVDFLAGLAAIHGEHRLSELMLRQSNYATTTSGTLVFS